MIILKSLTEDELHETPLATCEKFKASAAGSFSLPAIAGSRLINLREKEFKDLGLSVDEYLKVVRWMWRNEIAATSTTYKLWITSGRNEPKHEHRIDRGGVKFEKISEGKRTVRDR